MEIIKKIIVKVMELFKSFSLKLDSTVCYFLSVTGIAFTLKNIKLNEFFYLDYYKFIRLFGYLKNNVWPYKYTILMFLVLGYNYNWNRVSSNRLIRFFLIFMMLLIYKTYHNRIKDTKIDKINVKWIYYLMNINVIQNPVLYIIWKWDLYLYEIRDVLNKYNKYKSINILIMLLLINISMPIKILFKKYYMMLMIVKQSTLWELLFIRIYGLIISILIFSNIIQYIYKIAGSIWNLLIVIYVVLYVISVIYTLYNYMKSKNNVNINNQYIFWIQCKYSKFNKFLLFKYIKNYVDIIGNLTIYSLYEIRLNVSSTSYLIVYYIIHVVKNNVKVRKLELFKDYMYKIPNVWRHLIYRLIDINRIKKKEIQQVSDLRHTWGNSCISYIDKIRFWHLYNMQLKDFNIFFNHNNNKYIYYRVYTSIFHGLDDFLISLEAVIYYKYYNYKKAYIDYSDSMYDHDKCIIKSIQEYEYAYKLYVLILKNILHFIWTFEYNYYQDKSKLTKLYVIKDETIDDGLHINLKNNNDFKYECTIENTLIENNFDYDDIKINKLNNKHYENVYECIFILLNLPLHWIAFWTYINYNSNLNLKNIHIIYYTYNNKFKSNNGYPNLLLDLKAEYIEEYFMELDDIIKQIYKEWDTKDPYNIFDKRDVYNELANHLNNNLNNKCV